MRSKSTFLFLATILLASCAAPTPQPTVTSVPTSTTPSIFTATPTRRPPTASEPSWIQNDDGLLVFNPDTKQWEKVENPADGSGIYESGDKQFILMDNQLMWLASVSEVDGETHVLTKDGQKLVWAGGEWTNAVVTYTSEQIANMSETEKLASAPDQAGYTEAVSSVKDNLVKYYDADGNLDHAYDLLAGQEVSLAEAGIAEFDLNDRTKWEMLSFTDQQEVVDYVAANSEWQTGDRRLFQSRVFNTSEAYEWAARLRQISGGIEPKYDLARPWDGETFFWIQFVKELKNDGAYITFQPRENEFETIYFDDPAIVDDVEALYQAMVYGAGVVIPTEKPHKVDGK